MLSTKSTQSLNIQDISSYGQDCGQGNLVGIQPFMDVWDYADANRFYTKLNGYLQVVQANDWLRENSIVILPEYIGT